MGDLLVAMDKCPRRIRIRDCEALLEHAKVLRLRSQSHDLMDQELRPAEQRVEEAKLKLREAEIALQRVKLAVDAIGLQERKVRERFYTTVRNSTSQVRTLAERYGGEVSFTFDSNGRSVWVVAVFGKGAPPTLRTLSDGEVPWFPIVEDEEEGSGEGDDES